MEKFLPVQGMSELLKIHFCCYEENIFPWIQDDLTTPSWRFYWNKTPGGCLKVGNSIIPLVPEKFYIIPGYLQFSTFAETHFSQFYIHFNLSDRISLPQEIFTLDADPEIIAVIEKFIARPQVWENCQLTHLTAVSVLGTSLLRLDEKLFTMPPEYDPAIEKVIGFIDRHLDKIYTNEYLAGLAGISRNGFIRSFAAQTGESPQNYCRRKRIEKGCELLQFTDLSIDEIAEKTGFSDRFHFSRVFWKTVHTNPGAFRRQMRRRK